MFQALKQARAQASLLNATRRQWRVLLVPAIAWLTTLPAQAQPISSLYGRKIVVDSELVVGPAGKEIKLAVDEMTRVLGHMVRQEFTVSVAPSAAAAGIAEGIFLVPTISRLAPADAIAALKGKGREPFIIRSTDARKLWIISNGGEGLSHGIYYYLDLLGARWLNPGDAWEVIPPRTSIGGRISTLVEPQFKLRSFFGTGGFGRGLPVDPNGLIAERWANWKRRNRFGGEYVLGGHSGEAFNSEHKAILLKHPEYLAKVKGEHVPWSLIAKLNTANPAAVKLYVDWTVKRFRQSRKTNPNAFAVSVDPSDGGGHCDSEECKKIGNGSPSDQIFYIANEAAKAIRAEFPDGWVNLYGYNEHANPPSFAIEPNVYVSLIPYAFQRTGMSPEEFIKAWTAKLKRYGMYDYWSIPDWSADFPSFDFRNTPRQKLRLWRDYGIEAHSSESTYSGGAMGPGWYVASRLMWDPDLDDKAILNEWFELSFGPAQGPMRRMLERWASGFTLIGNEMARSYRDLSEARKLAQDRPDVLARLADYGRYIEYLRLRHTYDIAPAAEKTKAHRDLIWHVWSIYHSGMIHSFRIYQLLVRGNTAMQEMFPLNKPDAPIWKELTPITDAEVFERVESAARTLPLLDFTTQRYKGELVPLPKNLLPAGAAGAQPPESIGFIGQVSLVVQAPAGVKALNFKIASAPPTRVQLRDSLGKELYDKPTAGSAKKPAPMQEVSIPLPAPGRYRLTLTQEKNTHFSFAPPKDVLLNLLPFRTSKGQPTPPLYFFVPQGVTSVAIYDQAGLPEFMQPRLWTPTGEEVKAQVHEARRMLVYPVPAGQSGKVWKIARITGPNSPIDILNAPNTFGLTPEGLLVPKDALP